MHKPISIHVPLRGGRPISSVALKTCFVFQSTSPYAGDDTLKRYARSAVQNFNPRPPTRGTTPEQIVWYSIKDISIHVPLRGGRRLAARLSVPRRKISIHVPLRGGRLAPSPRPSSVERFQSTSPLRGGRLMSDEPHGLSDLFQSTSPYAGDDPLIAGVVGCHCKFQSTSPYHTPSISSQESPSRLFTVIL